MIPIDKATEYQRCAYPWVYDRIEVTGSRFTAPATGTHGMAVFERPSEPVAFCLLGMFFCEFPSGPNLGALADIAADVVGCGGFYGMQSGRELR